MKLNEHIYPYNTEVRKLPIHLTGIGGGNQYGIVRPEGYHWHQILFCTDGSGILKYDDTAVTVNKGDYFFLPAGYPHEYYTEEPVWDINWMTFDGYACAHTLSQFNMTKPIVIRPQESSAMQKIFSKMYTAEKTDRVFGGYTCSGLVYDYMIEFHRMMDTRANKVRLDRSRLLTPALNYIDEHFRTDFPLTILAEQVGVTPQHLCRVFREVMNMRPNEYLTQRRLQEAKRLLQRNELPISEVAMMSGFPDAGYFSTVFRKHEGITPMEYRKHIGIS